MIINNECKQWRKTVSFIRTFVMNPKTTVRRDLNPQHKYNLTPDTCSTVWFPGSHQWGLGWAGEQFISCMYIPFYRCSLILDEPLFILSHQINSYFNLRHRPGNPSLCVNQWPLEQQYKADIDQWGKKHISQKGTWKSFIHVCYLCSVHVDRARHTTGKMCSEGLKKDKWPNRKTLCIMWHR